MDNKKMIEEMVEEMVEETKKEKEQKMLEGEEKPKQVGFGKGNGNAKKNVPKFPF